MIAPIHVQLILRIFLVSISNSKAGRMKGWNGLIWFVALVNNLILSGFTYMDITQFCPTILQQTEELNSIREQQYKVFKKQNIRIGVFGLGIELNGLVNSSLYKETKYYDPIEITNEMTYKLKTEEKCDLIICISHLGHTYSDDKISDLKLGSLTSDIDLIIGGHTHTLLKKPEIIKNSKNKEVIINQVGSNGVYVGKIDFNFSNFYKNYSDSLVEV